MQDGYMPIRKPVSMKPTRSRVAAGVATKARGGVGKSKLMTSATSPRKRTESEIDAAYERAFFATPEEMGLAAVRFAAKNR